MTQEEKARAYDEALERAKELLLGNEHSNTIRSYFEHIFPELRESEDEKVIKALETFINQPEIADKITFEARIEWLSWLEKQKEQNGEDEECTDFTIYHPLKNGKGEYECIPYSFYGSLTSFSEDKDLIDFLRTCFYTEEECNEWIEQQQEQKPVRWKKDEEAILGGLLHKTGLSPDERFFLENLRPSWKPSKTQIMALEQWLKNHRFDGAARYIYPIFESLFNGLKTL